MNRLGVCGTSSSSISMVINTLYLGEKYHAQEFDQKSDIIDIMTAIGTHNIFGADKVVLVRDFNKRSEEERTLILDTPTECMLIVTALMEKKNSVAFTQKELAKFDKVIRTELYLEDEVRKMLNELAALHHVNYEPPVLSYLLKKSSDPVVIHSSFCRACAEVCPDGTVTVRLIQAAEREMAYGDDNVYMTANDVLFVRSDLDIPVVEARLMVAVLSNMLMILSWIWQAKMMLTLGVKDASAPGPHSVLLHPQYNLAEKIKRSSGNISGIQNKACRLSWMALARNIETVTAAIDLVKSGSKYRPDVLLLTTRDGGVCRESNG